MLVLPFLINQQIGIKPKISGFFSNSKLNLDSQVTNLVCSRKDVYFSSGRMSSVPPFCCKFRKDKECDLLAVANEDGEILLIDTERRGLVKSFTGHNNAIFDICWLPKENSLLTGSGDHRLYLFDINVCKRVAAFNGHTSTVKSVDVCQSENGNNNMFAAGSRDGNISIWDGREKSGQMHDKPSILIQSAHSRKHIEKTRRSSISSNLGSVSAVVFQDCDTLVSGGITDGVIKVWDLRRTYINKPDRIPTPRYQMNYADKSAGCTSLSFDSSHKTLYAGTTARKIYQFDCHSYTKTPVTYAGFKCKSYFVKAALSSDDQYILGGSSNDKAYIWKIDKPGVPFLELPGHTAEVTCVTWSPYNPTKLVTCGDDNKIFVWRYHNPHEVINEEEILESACEYNKDLKGLPADDNAQTSTLRNSSGKTVASSRTPARSAVQCITSFFSLTPTPSPCPVSVGQNGNYLLQNHTSPSECISPALPSQPRSPCKTLSENEAAVSGEGAASTSKVSPKGKENSTSSSSVDTPDKSKPSGQLKRKASTSRECKYHPEGCGRTRGHTRCGKKITITPAKVNITHYFSVSPPEK